MCTSMHVTLHLSACWCANKMKQACKRMLPDLNLLDIFIGYGVQHCVIFEVKHLVYTDEKI